MKKWIIFFYYLLPLPLISNSDSLKRDVDEQEIKYLEERLEKIHLQEMREDVESQDEMIYEWDEYASKVEKLKKLEEEERKLEMKINELKSRKKNSSLN